MKQYPDLLAGTPAEEKARDLSGRVRELSDFIVNVMKVSDVGAVFNNGNGKKEAPPKVSYHHSCHIIRGLGISGEPRILLGNVRGIEVVPLMHENACCGFGGEFSAAYPEISGAMVKDKVDNVVASGAQYLVLSEPGCILNIRGFIERKKIPITVVHLAQLLAGVVKPEGR